GVEPASVLELGAGTCPFARRSVFPSRARVVHTDLSPFMLARAADGNPGGARPTLVAANALSLPFKGSFDLVVMVYDAINYVMTENDLLRCLREARRVLAPGGLFLFDVTTESNSLRHFKDGLDFGELEGCTFVRESSYDRKAMLQRNDFTFFVEEENGAWRRYKEGHQQRIYRLGRLKALARKAGFRVEGCFEGFTFRQGREASERVHFALREPTPRETRR
ncbi:MAG TPA: methyltransferase domain-containing protein, partial [Fibrobacteria bacterium]|nr:methyltransferase domain-containing protein [Fibrobacteria bacterium]